MQQGGPPIHKQVKFPFLSKKIKPVFSFDVKI